MQHDSAFSDPTCPQWWAKDSDGRCFSAECPLSRQNWPATRLATYVREVILLPRIGVCTHPDALGMRKPTKHSRSGDLHARSKRAAVVDVGVSLGAEEPEGSSSRKGANSLPRAQLTQWQLFAGSRHVWEEGIPCERVRVVPRRPAPPLRRRVAVPACRTRGRSERFRLPGW